MENRKDTALLIQQYVNDRRALEIPNYTREDLGSVVRYTPEDKNAEGIVCFARITDVELDSEVTNHISYFQKQNVDFEWKIYDFDEPAKLRERLLDKGFEEGETESLMILDLNDFAPKNKSINDDIEVRRIEADEALKDIVSLQEIIWDRSFSWLFDQLKSVLSRTSFYCAYNGSSLIGTGWIEYPDNSHFAEIHGGSVLADYRGQGIYSQLFEIRMRDAIEKGVPYVAADASLMNMPNLERRGFRKLSNTYPLTMKTQFILADSRPKHLP
jgi:N-acetylglutamate synthase-like GNAT family acetyltransferase